MQTILLQDDPDLFRGLEHSLLCRDGITLLTAAADADLLETCRESGAQVVLLAGRGDAATRALVLRLNSLPHDPLCLVADCGREARDLLGQVESRLGVVGRAAPRRVCRVVARVTCPGSSCRGRTRDISASGTFVATTKALPENTPIVVEFASPGRRQGGRHAGVVVRSVSDDPSSQHLAGMAIRFAPGERLSDGQLDALPAAVARDATQ
ncbi:MAG: PilZ domain-containing protein [Acidobacteria bacterium]|nr:PilZ domain-containing protein [Acidobacteriota bacterium]